MATSSPCGLRFSNAVRAGFTLSETAIVLETDLEIIERDGNGSRRTRDETLPCDTQGTLESIHEKGINPSFSKVVLRHHLYIPVAETEWAKLHTAKRYSVPIAEIVIIAVEIPRSRLTRRWRGIWTTTETISEIQYARI